MSAEKFVSIFKSSSIGGNVDRASAYNAWKSKNKTWVNYNREELEKMGLSKRVGFALTAEGAAKLNKSAEFDKLVKDIRAGKPNRGPFLDESNGTPIVIYPGVAFKDGIERVLDTALGKGTGKEFKDNKSLVKGHVFGINTGALIGVKESILASKAISSSVDKDELNSAVGFLDVLIEHLQKLDIDSSDIKNFDSKILARYNKSSRRFLVEIQTEGDNAASAKLVQRLAGHTVNAATGIRGLMTPGGHQKALIGKLSAILKAQGLTDPSKLLKFESSPPMIDLITDEVMYTLTGKRKLKSEYTGKVTVGSTVVLYNNAEEQKRYRDTLNKTLQAAKAAKLKLKTVTSRASQGVPSTANLIALMQARLALQIRKNMGTGSARNVLNYRTGRFAESAKIEQISTSREGMLSVFYSYMKHPYATFSAGGAQSTPQTRDPKLLISKSIREIGASLVSNRMRAVLK